MIVLDTNVVSEPMKPNANPAVQNWLDRQASETLYLTAISLSELLVGIEILPPSKRKKGLDIALRINFDCIDLEWQIIRRNALRLRPTFFVLPTYPANLRNRIKVFIPAHYRKPVLERQRGDPSIVGRNWAPSLLQSDSNRRVGLRGVVADIHYFEIRQMFDQPILVSFAMPRVGYAVAELAEHDDRDSQSRFTAKEFTQRGVTVDKRRQRMGVQNHMRCSASTTSNSGSIRPRIFAVSVRSRRSLPKPAIHSGCAGGIRSLGASFSRNASETMSLRVSPRSAASDLTLRNRGSGISMVVFTETVLPYLRVYGKMTITGFPSSMLAARGSANEEN